MFWFIKKIFWIWEENIDENLKEYLDNHNQERKSNNFILSEKMEEKHKIRLKKLENIKKFQEKNKPQITIKISGKKIVKKVVKNPLVEAKKEAVKKEEKISEKKGGNKVVKINYWEDFLIKLSEKKIDERKEFLKDFLWKVKFHKLNHKHLLWYFFYKKSNVIFILDKNRKRYAFLLNKEEKNILFYWKRVKCKKLMDFINNNWHLELKEDNILFE